VGQLTKPLFIVYKCAHFLKKPKVKNNNGIMSGLTKKLYNCLTKMNFLLELQNVYKGFCKYNTRFRRSFCYTQVFNVFLSRLYNFWSFPAHTKCWLWKLLNMAPNLPRALFVCTTHAPWYWDRPRDWRSLLHKCTHWSYQMGV
jgi:hypothetical protein